MNLICDMKYTISAVFLCLSLIVSANEADDFTNWIKLNRPLVENGHMKRSEFYTQMFDRVSNLKAIHDKSNMLQATNMMIRASQEYEAGNIQMTELNNRLRDAQAVWVKPGISQPQESPRPTQPINLFGNQINCTSTTLGNTTNTNCR
jgi:hypothetical protein